MAKLRVLPLSPERWDDFVALFGARGACGGCWCMTPRLSRAEYEQNKGAGNKRKMHALVESGRVPGLIGYAGVRPVAWCSVEPRAHLPTLARSRVLAPVDDAEVWSIVCLFVDKAERGRGRSVAMIEAAVRYARSRGAHVVEAYPVEPKTSPMPPAFAWTGLASAYRRAGFVEIARRSATRPIMRRAT